MGLSVFLFALVVAFASWTGAAQALDVVPDGPPPEQRATTYNEIVACLSAKGAFKLPPAALQIAQEECEAKVSRITLNEYLAINTGCVLVLDDISRSLCVTGAEKLRAMFVPSTRDAPVAPQSLETAELRAIGSVCPLIRDGLTRSRCLTGVNKLKAVVAPNSGSARVDELDGWCAQAKKASSVVICSDAELRQQAIARNKLFEAARARLSPEDYKALTEDQSRWVNSYTAACGVPLDGPVPTLPVARYVIDCFTRASHARTAELATRLSEPAPAGKPLPTTEEASRPAPSSTEADAEKIDRAVREVLIKTGVATPRQAAAMSEWDKCTQHAAEIFAEQPEPARTVAEAAMAACEGQETEYILAMNFRDPTVLRDVTVPSLLARVMAVRAARAKLRQEAPKTNPAIDYSHM